MERRKLLQSLGLLPALMGVSAVIPTTTERKEPNTNWGTHHGFFYLWCGWVPVANQGIMVGHWIASQPDNPFGAKVYSSYPGSTYKYFSDQMFNTAVQNDQIPPSKDMPAEKLNIFKDEAFKRLLAYIDENREELTK